MRWEGKEEKRKRRIGGKKNGKNREQQNRFLQPINAKEKGIQVYSLRQMCDKCNPGIQPTQSWQR